MTKYLDMIQKRIKVKYYSKKTTSSFRQVHSSPLALRFWSSMKVEQMSKSSQGFVCMNSNKAMKIYNGNIAKSLVLGHINMGAGKCINKIDEILNVLCLKTPSILGVSETIMDLKAMDFLMNEDLQVETKDDCDDRISVILKPEVIYKRRKDLETDSFPCIWLEIGKGKSSFILGHCYREWQYPTSGTRSSSTNGTRNWRHQLVRWTKFVEDWQNILESHKEVHCMGDFNMNVKKWRQLGGQPDPEVQPCIDLLYERIMSKAVVQTVNEVTRSANARNGISASILDLHFTSMPEVVSNVTVESISNTSDHCYIEIKRKGKKEFVSNKFTIKRNLNKVNWKFATIQMEQLDRSAIYKTRDVDEVVYRTTAAISAVLDSQAPIRQRQNRKNWCPYMDTELLDKVREKKKKYKKWLRNRTGINWNEWKTAKNEVKKMMKVKKNEFIKRNIQESKSSKELWSTTKNVLGWNKKAGVKRIEDNGQLITDEEAIATKFNDFFLEKVQKINDKIPATSKDPLDYTRATIKEFSDYKQLPEFNFKRVDKRAIRKVINGLRTTTSTSYDWIPTLAIKKMARAVTPWLHRIMVLSFETNKFPTPWKTAKIIPIFKGKGDRASPSSYRPVALLPALSKVLESLMVQQISDHFEKFMPVGARRIKRLLSERQHGYRSNMSTGSTILQMIDDILKGCEEGNESALLMCDLSAAFDTVNHQLLLDKLKLYGMSENCINWFKSYLSGRKQFVGISASKSKLKSIKIGVFQGSCGGPLLFILFLNDLLSLEDGDTRISIYADDNNYLCKLGKDKLLNQLKMKMKLAQIEEYMNSNGLKFNVEKTQLMTMNPGQSRKNKDLCILFNNHLINQDESTKFLGIRISNNLRWNEYIQNSEDSLLNFCNMRLRALKLMSRQCDQKQRMLLANGMIISKITYCLSVWGNASIFLKQKVQSVLTETYRVVKQDFSSSTRSVHESLKMLSLDGWIRYLDLMTGKKIIDFQKPRDMMEKLINNAREDHVVLFGRTMEERTMMTRAMMRGNLRYTADNTTTYTPRHNSFIPRFVRLYNQLDGITKSKNLATSPWYEKDEFRLDVKYKCFKEQIYY